MLPGHGRSFEWRASLLVLGRPHPVLMLAVLVIVSIGIGCESVTRTASDDEAPMRPGSAVEWAELVEFQNQRLGLLDFFTSAGTITIDMRDEDDRMQREQADHRLWRGGATKTAIKISKLGSTLLSAAWNGPCWWVFDESGDDVTLRIRDASSSAAKAGVDRLLAPPILMAMIGLIPFPVEVPDDFSASSEGFRFTLGEVALGFDRQDESVAFPGRLKIRVRRPIDGPASVQLLSNSGIEVAQSELSKCNSVDRIGSAPGAWPRMPYRIEIRHGRGERVVMSFDAPIAGGRISERLFDLEVQIARSNPVRIDDARGAETK